MPRGDSRSSSRRWRQLESSTIPTSYG
uniref:Uncharacterized protein n=1 Tax=Rhizophora mucronata TaxID=61149 RepID=A0A2P2NER8_RHIMU